MEVLVPLLTPCWIAPDCGLGRFTARLMENWSMLRWDERLDGGDAALLEQPMPSHGSTYRHRLLEVDAMRARAVDGVGDRLAPGEADHHDVKLRPLWHSCTDLESMTATRAAFRCRSERHWQCIDDGTLGAGQTRPGSSRSWSRDVDAAILRAGSRGLRQ